MIDPSNITRREFALTAGAGLALLHLGSGCLAGSRQATHPSIFLTGSQVRGLRSVSDVRKSIRAGLPKQLWDSLIAKAESEVGASPLLPTSMVQDRPAIQAEKQNLDYYICFEIGQRITRNALAYLISEDERYRDTAWLQMQTIFDEETFPDWIDQAHMQFGLPAGLRTGMLSYDASLGYDWLYNGLTEEQRSMAREGLDRRAIQPFLKSVDLDAWYMKDLNNWTTVICRGVGVATMILSDTHPQTEQVLTICDDAMERYMSIYGPKGEFNENPAYANATLFPIEYFMARRYWKNTGGGRLAESPFPETCYWLKHLTLPPGRTAAFGDGKADARPRVKYFAAVAAATNDQILQKYYLDHRGHEGEDPIELLWYDASLEPASVDSNPLGAVFPAHGGCVVSRTSWDPQSTACVVYGKASREDNHEHHDAGTVCIDGYGERLIVDPGSPSGYPADFFEEDRWKYYNAGIVGHNVLMFDNQEMRIPEWTRGDGPKQDVTAITGRFVGYDFDDNSGGWWSMDLTNAYDNVTAVHRTVLHLHPGFVAVLDEAALPAAKPISLRWHTIDNAIPDRAGSFTVTGESCSLACRIKNLGSNPVTFRQRVHSYKAPFDMSRAGTPLEQRNESYVEAVQRGTTCRLLTLFALSNKLTPENLWQQINESTYQCGDVTFSMQNGSLRLSDSVTGRSVQTSA